MTFDKVSFGCGKQKTLSFRGGMLLQFQAFLSEKQEKPNALEPEQTDFAKISLYVCVIDSRK